MVAKYLECSSFLFRKLSPGSQLFQILLCRNVTALTSHTSSAFEMYYIFENTWTRGCWSRNKNDFLLFRRNLGASYHPLSPPGKGRRKARELYLNTPKEFLLSLETQDKRCNLTWSWTQELCSFLLEYTLSTLRSPMRN